MCAPRGFPVRAQIAAAEAIAGLVTDAELHPDYIIPRLIDYRTAPRIAAAVARACIDAGVSRSGALSRRKRLRNGRAASSMKASCRSRRSRNGK